MCPNLNIKKICSSNRAVFCFWSFRWQARRLAKEVLGSAQLPIEMSLDDMLLQAMISASMFNNQGTAHSHHGTGEPSPPVHATAISTPA